MSAEKQYLDLLKRCIEDGEEVENRTGENTFRVLGETMRFDFRDGFPLFTTKRVWFKGVVHELLWFLSGSTNIKYLVDNGVNIWNDDAYRVFKEDNRLRFGKESEMSKEAFVECVKRGVDNNGLPLGDLGPVYGAQWRKWHRREWGDGFMTIDQINNLIWGLQDNPSSRRHILSAWNVAEIDEMGLPPCHVMSQFTISKGRLWCQMYQRSCDTFLGVPYNVASYSLLTHMIAQVCGLEPGGFIWTGHDVHVYKSHIPAVKEQIGRAPKDFPTLALNPEISNIDKFKYDDIKIENYQCHPTIKAPLIT